MSQQHINVGSSPNDGTGDSLRNSQIKSESNFNELYSNKVDKIIGKVLSDTNYTQAEKDQLAALVAAGANVQSSCLEGDVSSPAYIIGKPENTSDFFNDGNGIQPFVPDVGVVGVFSRTAGGWIEVSTIDQTTYIITANGYLKTSLHRKFFTDWEWQIRGIYFTNTDPFEFDITLSSTGLQKFWLVVLTDIGFQLVLGDESTIPQTPNIPIDNIVVSTILITDSEVIESTPPITEVNFPKRQFTADGTQTTFDLTTLVLAKAVFWNGALLDDSNWSQSSNILTLTFTPVAGNIIKPI